MSNSQPLLSFSLLIVCLLICGCTTNTPTPESALEVSLPKQSDWVDYGTIFEAGKEGEWDHFLWGGFTGTAVKHNGTYYLYYQGSRDYLGAPYETVVWRAIGVATSQDGVNFTKYDQNPVVTWFPSGYLEGSGEEGAVSGGVTLDANGDFALVYGANTAYSPTKVNADGRLAISKDGFNFEDIGIVLDHQDKSLWGSGDELFPIASLHDGEQWIVYYLPNGLGKERNLGVAWGGSLEKLNNSSAVRSGLSPINAWGMAGIAKVGPGTYAIFTNWVPEPRTDVWLMSSDSPNNFSEVMEVYRFEDVSQSTILLDEEVRTWFMYYREEDHYGIKLSPAGTLDTTPPTAPTNLKGVEVNGQQIDLTWDCATDADTGIIQYKIYRDGEFLTSVKELGYSDIDIDQGADYTYSISAVNFHGTEGSQSKPFTPAMLSKADNNKNHSLSCHTISSKSDQQ